MCSPDAIRVGIVAPPWFEIPPPGYGGVENVVADLAAALVDLGHEVTVIGSGKARTPARFRQTLTEPPSDQLTEVMPELLHAAMVTEIVAGLDLDVVHDHSLGGPLVTTLGRVPAVVTVHYSPTGERETYLRHIGRHADLVAVSQAQRSAAPGVAWTGVVPNGVDVESFPYGSRKRDYALYLGRLARVKGVHLAIAAAAEAGLRLVVAGQVNDPAEHRYVAAEVERWRGPEVEILGPVDARRKRSLLAAARCLIFASAPSDPFGLVMIEAMACGTPVVALRGGAACEVVVDGVTGHLVDRPASLGRAVVESARIRPPDCRSHAAAHFDAPVMARRYLSIYRRALSDASRHRAPGRVGRFHASGPAKRVRAARRDGAGE
jgi:glycosyltransferase involved in cell wall biosynthesis